MAGKFTDFEEQYDARRDEERHGHKDAQEREKPSWRELDRRRDGVGHKDDSGSSGKPTMDRYQSAQASKELKAQLTGLFVDKAGADLRRAVLDAPDKAALQDAVQALLDACGTLPSDDPLLLDKALDVRKDALLGAVVDAVGGLLQTTDDVRRKVFVLKLRSKGRTTFDKKVALKIRTLLEQYGGA